MNDVIAMTSTQNHQGQSSRFSALPVKDILKIRMKELGLKNTDLQKALGYDKPNVIAMMKSGTTMRLPASKTALAANLLQVDPVFLLGKVISENYPGLWDAISDLLADHLVTASELALLQMVRQGLDGHDVNLAASPEFMAAAAPALKVILDRENALVQAAIKLAADE